ncbi:hypothetical protein BBP40_002611 [Aspergillus hancockii]|nr:hypothetical protein BBP40_002611 [Aspergillus hancockii]
MKSTFILLACASLISAAPPSSAATDAWNAAAVEDIDLPKNGFSVVSGLDAVGPEAYCGGLTPAGCRSICGRLGYRCWRCTSTACQCANAGC